MPDRDVQTVRDVILFQYAKIITKSTFSLADGNEAKKKYYGFIKKTFRDLKTGAKSWSDILREDWQFQESEKQCAYCGVAEELQKEHIVLKSLKIKPECACCDAIQGIHNQVWACKDCNLSKKTKGLYEFYRDRMPGEKKFFDFIPSLVEKKYLKTIFKCHECAGTLDVGDLNGDGVVTQLDIDYILH